MTTLPVRPAASVQPRSPALVSEVMGRIGSRDTEPEMIFRKALRRSGLRSFRACDASLPGKPDIVLPGKGLAIFVDGDFWHGSQYQARGFESVQAQMFGVHNAEYWTAKICRNVSRDFKNSSAHLNTGWRVLRFWESSIRKSLDKCVAITVDSMEKDSTELSAVAGLVRLALDRCGCRTVFATC
jgi:DNA mismatch endonuclease (patch repair protein)